MTDKFAGTPAVSPPLPPLYGPFLPLMFDVHAARQRHRRRRSFLLDLPGASPTGHHYCGVTPAPGPCWRCIHRCCRDRVAPICLLCCPSVVAKPPWCLCPPSSPVVIAQQFACGGAGCPGSASSVALFSLVCRVLSLAKRSRTGSHGVTCCVSRSGDTFAPCQSSFRLTRPDTSSILIALSVTVRTPPSRAPS